MIATPNDGRRPSHLALDRYATGELDGPARAELEARLDDDARAHLAALEQAKTELRPLDVAALRRRASPTLKPANNTRFYLSMLLVAAAVMLVVGVGQYRRGDTIGFRGSALEVFERIGRQLEPWGKEPLGEGDVVGFKVTATGHYSVVLLSVDAGGALSVFWPESGEVAEPLDGDGLVPLPGTLILDNAPGPEIFVAVYDRPVPEARMEAQRAYRDGGSEGLLQWADEDPDVDAVSVPRR